MECPYCGGKAQVRDEVLCNVERYGTERRARTDCCGEIIAIRMVPVFLASEDYRTDNKKDDWGR